MEGLSMCRLSLIIVLVLPTLQWIERDSGQKDMWA